MNQPHAAAPPLDLCERVPSYVRAIAPYQPGKPISELARELGLDEANIVKLASNENPLGASPRALQAMRPALDDVGRYPDGNGFELKQALAKRFGITQDSIVLGNGSNDVLELAARAFLAPGASAVFSRHAFAVYGLATQASGATSIEVPARSFGHDLEAMARAVRDDTRVVFIANPNNPTGTWVAPEVVRKFLEKLSGDILVVLDEAYNEYLPAVQLADSVSWLHRYPNLLVSRTFSKAYGLAGLRVGYGLAHPQVADLMNRVRQPFNVSSVAQAAAVAALGDAGFVERSFELNRAGMQQLVAGFKRLGLSWIESHANFVCLGVANAAHVYQHLLRKGVIVRPVGSYSLPEHLRVSIGLETENARFLAALEEVLSGRV
ncbi:MAG: histidinol-phosphate transaminase [Burkholderiales bacterium]